MEHSSHSAPTPHKNAFEKWHEAVAFFDLRQKKKKQRNEKHSHMDSQSIRFDNNNISDDMCYFLLDEHSSAFT